jgi:EAL domain-containing protein (putative c-di-GMP-specific phosphodiesterase class I)
MQSPFSSAEKTIVYNNFVPEKPVADQARTLAAHVSNWAATPESLPVTDAPGARVCAYLERYPEQGGPAERVPLQTIPFTIGRSEAADHTVYSSKVSSAHATIVLVGDRYAVQDLKSTNGTFVNGQRRMVQFLEDGDIIHLAHVEFCFRRPTSPTSMDEEYDERMMDRTVMVPFEQPNSIIRGTRLLREMIEAEAVEILYQPIVELKTREVFGYEALGRGAHPGLSRSPASLLLLAEQCGMVVELSQLLGRLAVSRGSRLPRGARIFVNVHARELAALEFLASLPALRRAAGDRPIVIEITESSLTDVPMMAQYKKAFASHGFECAYDDFGTGQGRLIELADVPPNYLKCDRSLIDGIETAKPRQEMTKGLLAVMRSLGVRVIAEGVETEPVAAICRQLGYDLAQGYLFGRPA